MAHLPSSLPACANCGYDFGGTEHFCPNCGQQNHPLDLSFGHVAEEVLEGVFHFDGKVFRTLRLLLFAPGQLTLRFWEGKRVAYVPPVRLYVLISFVFFLLLSLALHAPEHHEGLTLGEQFRQSLLQYRADTARLARLPAADSAARYRLQQQLRLQRQLSLLKGAVKLDIDGDTASYRNVAGAQYTWREWREVAEASPPQLNELLRLHGVKPSLGQRFLLKQANRLSRSTEQDLAHQFVRGGSLLMFVLMPVFALLLKALYRRGRYYLAHLMFAIHVHCFAFVLFGLNLALALFFPASKVLLAGTLLVLAGYVALALRTTYQQSWGLTGLKFLLLTFVYGITLMGSLLGTLLLSVALV